MTRIGSFKQVSGEFRGQIATLTFTAKSVRIVPDTTASGNAPGYRLFAGEAEIGAAWDKRTRDDRPYLSVKLDDPAFATPIFAQLFESDEGSHDLIWSRQTRRQAD